MRLFSSASWPPPLTSVLLFLKTLFFLKEEDTELRPSLDLVLLNSLVERRYNNLILVNLEIGDNITPKNPAKG